MKLSTKKQKGFTLIEILIVISIIAILAVMGLSSFNNSNELIKFKNFTNQVAGLFREARGLALTGEAMPDYTDYDEDKVFYPENNVCSTNPDQKTSCPNSTANDCYCNVQEKVLAAGYGVYFTQNFLNQTSKLHFFTDLHNKSEGTFDAADTTGYTNSQDQIDPAKSINPNASVEFKNYNFLVNSEGLHGGLIYTTPHGDVIFTDVQDKDMLLWLYNKTQGCVVGGKLQGVIVSINKVAGIPEIINADVFPNLKLDKFNTKNCTK